LAGEEEEGGTLQIQPLLGGGSGSVWSTNPRPSNTSNTSNRKTAKPQNRKTAKPNAISKTHHTPNATTMTKPSSQQNQPMMYLHLCCEGWQRFGPFQWLSLQNQEGVIVDQDGQVVARREAHCWRTVAPQFEGYGWENPTITVGPKHPHPNSGVHPRYRSRQNTTSTHDDPN